MGSRSRLRGPNNMTFRAGAFRSGIGGLCGKAVIVLALMAVLLGARYGRAGEESSEYYVKAAFLYHLAEWVRWPVTPEGMTICLTGPDRFGNALSVLKDKTINQRPVQLRREVPEDAWGDCQILYLAPALQPDWADIRRRLEGKPVMTVSDMPGFAEAEGMVGFIAHKRRVRLEVNPRAAVRSHLLMTPELLKMAHRVVGDAP